MCHVGVIMKVLPNVLFLYIACSDIHTVAIKNILGAMNIFCENGKKKKCWLGLATIFLCCYSGGERVNER